MFTVPISPPQVIFLHKVTIKDLRSKAIILGIFVLICIPLRSLSVWSFSRMLSIISSTHATWQDLNFADFQVRLFVIRLLDY